MKRSNKIIELEALRGIAAMVVLISHFMLAFTPRIIGLLDPNQDVTLFGTPAFALINGSAAVILFFVLSGFVLTAGMFPVPNLAGAVLAILKRWPRLAATVMLANLVAGALMALKLYSNLQAAPLAHSIWLERYYAWPTIGITEIGAALTEGATTFFTGKHLYNNALWTMYFEFYGSIASIICAVVTAKIPARRLRDLVFVASWLGLFVWHPYLSPFVAGVWIASRHCQGDATAWSNRTALAAVIPLMLLMGYSENFTSHRTEGWYAFLDGLIAYSPDRIAILLNTAGAMLAMMMFLRVPAIKCRLSGPFGEMLGFLSFGIYLAQVPIICSLSSWTYVVMSDTSPALRMALTLCATIIGTLSLAIPLAFFDRWWVRWLNGFAQRSSQGAGIIAVPLS